MSGRPTRACTAWHRAHLPRLAAGGRATGCCTTTSTRRSPSAPTTSSCTAAPAGRRGRGTRSTRCAARSPRSADDETMLVQSGKPVGVFRTHEWAPRVLIANSNLVPEWGNWDEFRRLEALGLTMYGQMTAGSWIYIGTQGILQGTYECFAEIARRRFGGTLAGTITLTAGLGGMGGAQPLAVTMNDGVALCIEVDAAPRRAPRRDRATSTRSPTRSTTRSRRCVRARDERRPLSVGLRRQRRRARAAAARPRTSRPTSSPTRRAPTTRSATCRPTSRRRRPPRWRAPTRRS